jgi:hypothetical protein
MWLDIVRYYVAILMLIGLPAGILMWLLIHLFAKFWQRVGRVWAYLIVAVPMLLLAGTIVWGRETILAADYGTNHVLIALSVIPFALAIVIYLSRVSGQRRWYRSRMR